MKLRLSLIVATLVLLGSTWIGVIKLRIKLHPTNPVLLGSTRLGATR